MLKRADDKPAQPVRDASRTGGGAARFPHGIDVATLFTPLLPFSRIGIAVSGGPDSLGLMLLASAWAREAGKEVVVYTVDHGLRPEAAAECALVLAEAERLGLLCRMLKWTEPKPPTGIQAAARAARYRLIGAAMAEDGTEILVTAHHRNDQAETILMRMAHGSGLAGLSGMDLFGTVEGVRLCRPLLQMDPMHLRDVVRDAGLTAVADPSNTDEHYERVRWRHALPALAREGLDADRFAALSRRLARANAALDKFAGDALASFCAIDRFGVVTLPFAVLADLPEEVGLRVFERILVFAGGGRDRYRLAQVEEAFWALLASQDAHSATLGGAAIVRAGTAVEIFREYGRMAEPATISLGSGASFVWDGRFAIACAAEPETGLAVTALGERLTRAEAETLVGRIDVLMRALATAPVLIDRGGQVLAIGAGAHGGVRIEALVPPKARQTGQ